MEEVWIRGGAGSGAGSGLKKWILRRWIYSCCVQDSWSYSPAGDDLRAHAHQVRVRSWCPGMEIEMSQGVELLGICDLMGLACDQHTPAEMV